MIACGAHKLILCLCILVELHLLYHRDYNVIDSSKARQTAKQKCL